MRRLGCGVLSVGVALCSIGCNRLLDSRDVRKRSAAMVLLADATDVVYYHNYDRSGRPESEQISYLLAVPFPAESVVCQVSVALVEAGWRPSGRTAEDSYRKGWQVLINRRGRPDEAHVDLWDAEWVNAKGERVSYSLTYRYPSSGSPNRSVLRVTGLWEPSQPGQSIGETAMLAPGAPPRITSGQFAHCGAAAWR